ncbi:MAG: lasso peptide biosynthesis B2 protein [Gemmatimonadaceae bacterium]
MTHLLRRAASLSLADWTDLVRAQWALIVAQLLVWTRPTGRLLERPAAPVIARDQRDERAGESDERTARRLALAVERGAAYGMFRPLCLVRAVALDRMLHARGIRQGVIRVGVRRVRDRFVAHAWVELGGEVLGDRAEHTATFAPLFDASLLRRR